MNKKLAVTFCLIAFIITALLAVVRWRGENMHRPLEYDEFLTVEYYTLAGLKPSGDQQPLRRESLLSTLPRPGVRQIVMGFYRSWAVWREPNNHVVNSLLIDLTLIRAAATGSNLRLPALAGGVIFAWLLMVYCGWAFRAWPIVPLVAVWAFCTPYMVDFSQSARGYTWMLALQALLIFLEYCAAQKPSSMIRPALCVVVAFLSIANMVNLAVDWIFPLFVALFFAPPLVSGFDKIQQREWRRNVFMQASAVFAATAVFFMDRFAYLASSAGQYGEAMRLTELPRRLLEMFQYLFPGMIWPLVGLAGIIGLAMMWKSPQHRFISVLAACVFAISVLHFAAARKTPYLRGIGYFLPFFLIGAGYALQQLLQFNRRRLLAISAAAIATAITVATILPTFAQRTIDDRAASAFAPLVSESQENRGPLHAVLPPIKDYILRKALPASWQDDQDPLIPNQETTLAFFVRKNGAWGIAHQQGPNGNSLWRTIPHLSELSSEGSFAIANIPVGVRALESSTSADEDVVFLAWYPDPNRLALNSPDLINYVADSGIAYIRRDTRVYTKIDFYSRLLALEFVPENTEDCQKIIDVVRGGLERFGGNAVIARRRAPATAPASQRAVSPG